MPINPETIISECLETGFGLETYTSLINSVALPEFVATPQFRKKYNGYFRVIFRSQEWYNQYYDLMTSQRENPRTFSELIQILYPFSGNIEASYVSKLMATVDPSLPIWDQHVLRNLQLQEAWRNTQGNEFEQRLESANAIYENIRNWYSNYLESNEGQLCIQRFNEALPDYSNVISNTKKIDYFLWSMR